MDLLTIIKYNVDFCHNSGITVETDSAHGTVLITDGNAEIFLQDDEGYAFIDQCKALHEMVGTIGMDEAELFYAYDYATILGES